MPFGQEASFALKSSVNLDLPEPQAGEKTLPDGALDVTLKDVHFSYEEDREILKGIGLNLPAGSFVSLVGESGCGKSTIAGILAAMLMYGKEASNRKQEIDRQHHTIPNKRTKDKHYGNVHNRLWNHG